LTIEPGHRLFAPLDGATHSASALPAPDAAAVPAAIRPSPVRRGDAWRVRVIHPSGMSQTRPHLANLVAVRHALHHPG